MPPSRVLPPVEFCRGTRPTHAANSRPLRKAIGSTTVAAIAGGDRSDARNGRQLLAHRVAPVPGHQLPLKLGNRRLDLLDLSGKHLQHSAPQIRQTGIALIADHGDQLANIAQALRRNHSELGQMRTQGIHHHGALAYQPLAATVQQQGGLLLSRLDWHKAHRRPQNCLANRFRVGPSFLLRLT